MPEQKQTAGDDGELLGDDPVIIDLLETLGRDSSCECHQAANLSARAGPLLGTAVRRLLLLLKDCDPAVRVEAASALGILGGQARRVLPELYAALKETALRDENDSVRTQAVLALIHVGPQPNSEVAALIDSLHNELAVVRLHAAIALGEYGRDALPAVPNLKHTSLWDSDPAARVEAAVALWKIDANNGSLVLPILIKALTDANELVCWIAADCLGQMGPDAQPAIPALRLVMARHFKIPLIRLSVAVALRRIDVPHASKME